MPNLFTKPPRFPLVAASILSADFTRMGDECRAVLQAGADLLHLDVMDGHFVPNLTMGPDLCRWLRRAFPDAFLDVHLMVDNPGLFIAPFAKAGASNLTFHIEVADLPTARKLAADAHNRGCTAGLAINPPTPAEQILPYLPDFDVILVMSVNPGFSGQSFIEPTLEKTRLIKPRLRRDQRLEMDGGIGPDNVVSVRKAGCDVLVAASAIFGVPPPARAEVIGTLRAR